jgi:hypothetical protein
MEAPAKADALKPRKDRRFMRDELMLSSFSRAAFRQLWIFLFL